MKGPKYVGACFLLPSDPSLYAPPDAESGSVTDSNQTPSLAPCPAPSGKHNRKETLDEFISLVSSILPGAIPNVRSFFYIFYPVSDLSWLCTESHGAFVFRLYSALNRAAVEKSENPALEIGVFPVHSNSNRVPYGVQTFSPIQLNAFANLIFANDPSTPRFIDRREPDGPVAFFIFSKDDEKRETPTHNVEKKYQTFREPHLGSSLTNSILQFCQQKSFTPHIVDATQYIEGNISTAIISDHKSAIKPFDSTLIGGTFDHLHSGHKLLLSLMVLMSQKRITVGVVDDGGAAQKAQRYLVQPFVYRSTAVIRFLQISFHLLNISTRLSLPPDFQTTFRSCLCPGLLDYFAPPSGREIEVTISELHDKVGPAGEGYEFNCLIITSETQKGGEFVNVHRVDRGFGPIELVKLPLLENSDEHKSSEEKVSSSKVRESFVETPMIQDLRTFWDRISSTLQLPPLIGSIWGIRLLGHYAVPWRRVNRSRLRQMLEQLWMNSKFSDVDKAWLSLAFWLSLCVINEEAHGERWKIEQRISRDKLRNTVNLFCQDYSSAISLCLCPDINTVWRTRDSRLHSFVKSGDEGSNNTEERTDSQREIELIDVRDNLISLGNYLLASFVPKSQQLVDSDASPIGSPKSGVNSLLSSDCEIKKSSEDLLRNFQQTIDYFVYEFFQMSYRT